MTTSSKMPKAIIDGKNIWPLLSGKKGAKSPHKAFYYYAGRNLNSIRNGDWKQRGRGDKALLYNLKVDISESNNVAKENPEIVERLTKMMIEFDKNLKSNIH